MGSIWFPLCCLPSRGPPPSPPSGPCSRDGSSHAEQFPISFVHAGSSTRLVPAVTRCTAGGFLWIWPLLGEPQAVQQPAALLGSAFFVCLFLSRVVPLVHSFTSFLFLCPAVSSSHPLISAVATLKHLEMIILSVSHVIKLHRLFSVVVGGLDVR